MKLEYKAGLARALLRGLAATWRIREEVPPDCRAILSGDQIAVIAFWHFQMLPLWYRLRTLEPAAIVSASADGEILSRYLAAIGYARVLRGSSSRGGSQALAEAVGELSRRSLAITPDGPRGPARQARAGAVVAALRAGVPLVVAGWTCSRSIRFSSWDRMEVPLPFSVINVRFARFSLGDLSAESTVSADELLQLSRAIDAAIGE